MKYIRTKESINPVEREEDVELFKKTNQRLGETIEELCDYYVVWLKNRELPIIEKPKKGFTLFPSYFEIGECHFDKGYGAIWTDKGLIYVAKMNDKGELELL